MLVVADSRTRSSGNPISDSERSTDSALRRDEFDERFPGLLDAVLQPAAVS